MKKIISAILATTMTASLAVNCFATQSSNTYEAETGVYHCFSNVYQGNNWETIVYVPNNGEMIRVDAKSRNSEAIYSVELHKTEINHEWVEETVANLANDVLDSEVHYVSEYVSENSISPLSSAEEDLFDEMRDIYGNEYSNKVLKTYYSADFPKVSRIQVKSDLFYRASSSSFSFSSGTSLGQIALSLCGISTPDIVSSISTLLGVAESISSRLTGTKYQVIANYGRYCYVNGTSTIYNDTYKFVKHIGIDPDIGRAGIINEDDPTITFSDSASYFASYYSQATDAYNAYLN